MPRLIIIENIIRYYREKKRYCERRECLTEKDNCCEMWHKKKRELDLSSERFERAENDLLFILEYAKSLS